MSQYIPMPKSLRFFLHSHLWKIIHFSLVAWILLLCDNFWDYIILFLLSGCSFWAVWHGVREDLKTFQKGKPQECNCWLGGLILGSSLLGLAVFLVGII